jgi:hypothetical protein
VIEEWADDLDPDHDDAHVRARDRLRSLATIYLCEGVIEEMKLECERALERVEIAKRSARAAVDRLNRAIVMTEQACKLHSIVSSR